MFFIPRPKIHPPGPRPQGMKNMRDDPLGFPMKLQREWGDLVYSPIGPAFRPTYMVFNPETIEHVLVRNRDNYVKSLTLRRLKGLFGNSVLVSEGEEWRKARRIMAPAFHRKALERYLAVMDECTMAAIEQMKAQGRFELQRAMMELTLDIAMKCFFSSSARGVVEKIDRGMEDLLGFADLTIGRVLPTPVWLPIRQARNFRRGYGLVCEVVNELIQKRKQSGEEHDDVLGLLLAARDEEGNALTDIEVRDEVITLLLAGHETTALALTYTLFLLSHRPELVERLRAEAADLHASDAPLSSAALKQLSFQDQCIKEALRLYPPVGIIARETVGEDTIEGWPVPAGVQVLFSIWAIHHDGRYYEDPWRYVPERWTPEFEAQLPRFAYFPFGGGQRVCIGDAFAKYEAAVVTLRVLQHLKLTPEQSDIPKLNLAVTMRPEGPVMMRAEAIQGTE